MMMKWKDKMISGIKKTWEEEYRGHCLVEQDQPKQLDFLDRHFRKPQVQASNDQLNSFITATPVELANETDEDLIAWWMRPSNPWKALHQQALDLLYIPAMSAEVERVFSSAKRLVTPNRNRLNDETIEILQLLKYWWDQQVIAQAMTKTLNPARIA